MSDLQKAIQTLDEVMKQSEAILKDKRKTKASDLANLQTKSNKITEQLGTYRAKLVEMSLLIFDYEEYYNVVHPMWGGIDAARKLLAMGKRKAASKMLEKAQASWEKEVFTFDRDVFPPKVASKFDGMVTQIDDLFAKAFKELDADDPGAEKTLRSLLSKADNLFDVQDDSLDTLLGTLKAI